MTGGILYIYNFYKVLELVPILRSGYASFHLITFIVFQTRQAFADASATFAIYVLNHWIYNTQLSSDYYEDTYSIDKHSKVKTKQLFPLSYFLN